MTESAIKSNQREAARLFERGVAAASSGQRRVAAVLADDRGLAAT